MASMQEHHRTVKRALDEELAETGEVNEPLFGQAAAIERTQRALGIHIPSSYGSSEPQAGFPTSDELLAMEEYEALSPDERWARRMGRRGEFDLGSEQARY